MSGPARVLVVAAIAVLAVGWLWSRDDGATMPEPAPTPTPMQANEPVAVTAVSVTPTVATEDNVADLPLSPGPAPDDAMAALVGKLADRMRTTVGTQFVEHLVSKGLSEVDSERAVAEVMPDWVRCQVDATLALAGEQSVSRAAVLEALDAQGLFAVPAPLDAVVAIARGYQCRSSVQQRIGIAPGFGFRRTGR